MDDLFLLAQKGDTQARDQLLEKHKGLAHYWVQKLIPDLGKQDDALQEALIALCVAIQKFDVTRGFQFSTYASMVLKNRIRMSQKLRRSQTMESGGELHDSAIKETPEQDYDELYRAIGTLKGRYRRVIDGKLQGKMLHELGADLGVTKERARQVLMHAYKQLKKELENGQD